MSTEQEVKDRDTGDSDPGYVKLRSKNLPWWKEDLEGQLNAAPEIRTQFETYSNITPDQVVPHIRAIRAKLWDLRAYPCTGLSVFLIPFIKYHSAFTDIVSKLKSTGDSKFLDIGSYIGHDLRAVHWAGVPQSSLYALDLLPFWELGYELFNDRDKFGTVTVLGDVLDFDPSSPQAELDGKMDVVYIGAVLHQLSWERSVTACKRLIQFSKGPRALIVGYGVGTNKSEGEIEMGGFTGGRYKGTDAFKHNEESTEKMWKQVREESGIKLDVKAKWNTWESFGCEPGRCAFLGPDMGVLEFTVWLR